MTYIKITSQCKILIVPEEGWFGQPKYSTPTKNHSTLCRLLLLFSTWFLVLKLLLCYVLKSVISGNDDKPPQSTLKHNLGASTVQARA